ncbi:MAG: hypothetical protein OXG38_03430 [Chloroflexi bacterium]|nr:hypothetical protein [Chloroflexota bacterium]
MRLLTRNEDVAAASGAGRSRLDRARSLKWLGQTAASVCWMSSMVTSGVESTGDWLQLCAASAWLVANIATLMTTEAE